MGQIIKQKYRKPLRCPIAQRGGVTAGWVALPVAVAVSGGQLGGGQQEADLAQRRLYVRELVVEPVDDGDHRVRALHLPLALHVERARRAARARVPLLAHLLVVLAHLLPAEKVDEVLQRHGARG